MKTILGLILLLPNLVLAQGIGFTVSSEEFTLNEKYIQDVSLRIGRDKEYLLDIKLNKDGEQAFEEFLTSNISKDRSRLNIIFKNEIVLSLTVHETSFSNFTVVISNKSQAMEMLEALTQ